MSFGVLRRAAASVASGIVVFALTPALAGQSGSSTIAGVVRDATGAPIPAVSISLVNEETAVSLETLTNGEGVSSARPARIVRLGARLTP